jgi:hypothetical protein
VERIQKEGKKLRMIEIRKGINKERKKTGSHECRRLRNTGLCWSQERKSGVSTYCMLVFLWLYPILHNTVVTTQY